MQACKKIGWILFFKKLVNFVVAKITEIVHRKKLLELKLTKIFTVDSKLP